VSVREGEGDAAVGEMDRQGGREGGGARFHKVQQVEASLSCVIQSSLF
jgi:hypothetical protein